MSNEKENAREPETSADSTASKPPTPPEIPEKPVYINPGIKVVGTVVIGDRDDSKDRPASQMPDLL